MIAIKHRYTNATLCEFDVATVKEAVEQGSADLRSANLHCADLHRANLRGANLHRANLRGANLDGANLRGANLRGANLRGANLDSANLDGANLSNADLDSANLSGANLDGANLLGANLDGANLRGANLEGANLDAEKLTKSPLSIVGLRYWCLISEGFMRLGCKRFTHQEWTDFDDEQISEMDDDALKFWTQWKTPLLEMCKAHAPK